jgi:hypothetical protein
MQMMARRDELMPLHSIRLTQHARLRDYINDPVTYASEIQSSYETTFSEIVALRERRRNLQPACVPKDKAIFYIAYSVALSYGIMLNTIMLRVKLGVNEQNAKESNILMDEIVALSEAAAQFSPLGSSAMSSLLLVAWPNDPSRRPVIEEWLRSLQGGFPIARWIESARWLDEMLVPPASIGQCGQHGITRPPDACNVM